MIDANRDGFIDKEDLKDTYASLGTSLRQNKFVLYVWLRRNGYSIPLGCC